MSLVCSRKTGGDYNFFSPIIIFTGNAAVLGFGGFSLTLITNLALRMLGFSETTAGTVTAIPATMSAISAAGAVFGSGIIFYKLLVELTKDKL